MLADLPKDVEPDVTAQLKTLLRCLNYGTGPWTFLPHV